MFYPEVHKGDKFSPSASRENAINRRLNSINGFSEVPITKKSSSSSSTSALGLDISSTTIDDVEYWNVTTEWFVVQHRTGDYYQPISDLLIPKYTENSDGVYAHLTLFPTISGGYSCCYRLASYNTTGDVSDIAGSSYLLCKSSDTIMLTKPIAILAIINTSTGEVVYSYPDTRFFDLYYHGVFEVATIINSDGYATYISGGTVYFGSAIENINSSSFSKDSFSASPSVYLESTWDGESLECSFVESSSNEDTYVDVIEIKYNQEYPNGLNIVGRIMP